MSRRVLLAVAVLLALGHSVDGDTCSNADTNFCNGIAASGLCQHPYIQNVTRANCPLSCGACTPSSQSDQVWICAFPPKETPTERCVDFQEDFCYNITLNTCTKITTGLPLFLNTYVLVSQNTSSTQYKWSFHLDSRCEGPFNVREPSTGVASIGDCQRGEANALIGHFADIELFETCAAVPATNEFYCTGNTLPCSHPALKRKVACPADRCVYDTELAMCSAINLQIPCGLYSPPACGPPECVHDEYLNYCRLRDACSCSPSGLINNVPTGHAGCAIGSQQTDFPGKYGCYLDFPTESSTCACAQQSALFPGARWRTCEPGCPFLNVQATPLGNNIAVARELSGMYGSEDSDRYLPFGVSDTSQCFYFPLWRKIIQDNSTLFAETPILSTIYFLQGTAAAITGNRTFWAFSTQGRKQGFLTFVIDTSVNLFSQVTALTQDAAARPEDVRAPVWTTTITQGVPSQDSLLAITLTCTDTPPCPTATRMRASVLSARTALLSWEQSVSLRHPFAPDSFTVTCTGTYLAAQLPGESSDSAAVSVRAGVNTTALLTALEPFVQYTCTIIAESESSSNTSTGPTAEATTTTATATTIGPASSTPLITSCKPSSSLPVLFATLPSAPAGPPTDIVLTRATPTSLTISWSPPRVKDRRGVILGYFVFMSRAANQENADPRASGNSTAARMFVDAASPSATFTHLEEALTYTFRLHAVSMDGMGPNTTVFAARTLDALPSVAPAATTVTRVGANTVRITWLVVAPADANGAIIGYRIREIVVPKGTTNVTTANFTSQLATEHNIARNETAAVISNLDPRESYAFAVAAVTSAGVGPFSDGQIAPEFTEASKSDSGMASGAIIAIIVAALVFAFSLFALFVSRHYHKRRRAEAAVEMEVFIPAKLQPLEIPRENITLLKELGEGHFGSVLEASVFNLAGSGRKEAVAVKMLKQDHDPLEKRMFVEEAANMVPLQHPHVIGLLGVVFTSSPQLICVPLMRTDLRKYLREHRALPERPALISPLQQVGMAVQVADGLQYLASMRYVHRDIAARNVLIDFAGVLKIGDFGMARVLNYGSGYYRKVSTSVLPLRWVAPESLIDGSFTPASDVWMFGVLLWEIFSFGQVPWPGVSDSEVAYILARTKQTMARPPGTPNVVFKIMLACWNRQAKDRPSAKEVFEQLKECEEDDLGLLEQGYNLPVVAAETVAPVAEAHARPQDNHYKAVALPTHGKTAPTTGETVSFVYQPGQTYKVGVSGVAAPLANLKVVDAGTSPDLEVALTCDLSGTLTVTFSKQTKVFQPSPRSPLRRIDFSSGAAAGDGDSMTQSSGSSFYSSVHHSPMYYSVAPERLQAPDSAFGTMDKDAASGVAADGVAREQAVEVEELWGAEDVERHDMTDVEV